MDWNQLPSVVLVQVYSLLPTLDRLHASSVCKNWRQPAFQAPFSPSLNLSLRNHELDGPQIEFQIQHFVHKITNLSLTFNPTNPSNLDLVENVLMKLEGNRHLRSLKLRCSEDSLAKDVFCGSSTAALILRTHFIRKVVQPLVRVLRNRACLETFSFPLVNELVHFEDVFYSNIGKTSKLYSLRNLFLATLRICGKNNFNLVTIPSSQLKLDTIDAFTNLQVVSIDHEMLNDEILAKIGTRNNFGGLERLVLLATQANMNVSNNGWVKFISNNPKCGVRLTMIGDGVIFDQGSNLLFPCIPLTHFRALYCKEIRLATMNSMISWNETSLQHIELVHENYDWMEYIAHPNDEDQFLDPIIYSAWRCQNLRTLKIGFFYCGQSLVGIARLKGPSLINLEILRSKVVYHNIQQLSSEVSKALGRPWKPIEESNERRKKPNVVSKKFIQGYQAVIADEN